MKVVALILGTGLLFACSGPETQESYYPDGGLKETRTYLRVSDRGDGNYRFKHYRQDGRLEIEGGMVNGKKNGAWTEYHANGSVRLSGAYREGIPYGTFEERFANGSIKKRWHLDINGQENGQVFVWNQDGLLLSEGQYQSGKAVGTWVFRSHEDGRLTEQLTYAGDGTLLMTKTYNHDQGADFYHFVARGLDGYLDSTGAMFSNTRIGYWRRYNDSGSLLEEGSYQSNLREGKWTHWHAGDLLIEADSLLKASGMYAAGKKTGTWFEQNADASIQQEWSYQQRPRRLLSHSLQGQQTVRNGRGYVDSISYSFTSTQVLTIRHRTSYRDGLPQNTSETVIDRQNL